MNRRNFIKLTAGSLLLSNQSISALCREVTWTMPEEDGKHQQTWMAFVADDHIWLPEQIPVVKQNLVLIATTIAKYESVSVLVNPTDYAEAIALFGDLNRHPYPITLVKLTIDDLWLRDTGATFVKGSDGKKYGIDFNFNGWGNKQIHENDAKVANFITNKTGAITKSSSLVLEGGCFEVDGHGTAILTKSCVLNSNRNPDVTQTMVETELDELLGIKKIIWLEGIKGKDITDGHTDFYARFTRKGRVLVSKDNYQDSYDYAVTRQNIETLKNATDAQGNKLDIIIIDTPEIINEEFGTDSFAAGYIGYYACNNAIIMQSFGDQYADKQAKTILQQEFPNRTIEQIRIDGIASGGGSIHCATQQEPNIANNAIVNKNLDIHLPSASYNDDKIWVNLQYNGVDAKKEHIWKLKDYGIIEK
ncbi:agmatine deiminase family protein [Candidatus Halobeggiatoa sp. HSG11]|nr:agmatine deiminase family protein [Candidatus Halobeggiatoa sp. HSG11]